MMFLCPIYIFIAFFFHFKVIYTISMLLFFLWYNTFTIQIQSQILISYLSLSWLFESHSQPANVRTRHSYRPA